MKAQKQKIINYLYIAMLVFFLGFCCVFIPSFDDVIFNYDPKYDFHSLTELFEIVRYYGNGRYFSNFVGILLGQLPLLCDVVIFVLTALFCQAVEGITDMKNARVICLAGIVMMPIALVQNSISVICIFFNYLFPVYLMAYAVCIVTLLVRDKLRHKAIWYVVLFALGFLMQLCLETNTIVNIMLSAMMCFGAFIKKSKNAKAPSIILAVSNLAGAALMFANKLLVGDHKVFAADNYRTTILMQEGLTAKIKYMVSNGHWLVMLLGTSIVLYSVVFYAAAYIEKHSDEKKLKHPVLVKLLCFAFYPAAALLNYTFICKITIEEAPKWMLLAIAVLLGLSGTGFAVLLIKGLCLRLNKRQNATIIVLVLLSIISFAPFLLVGPAGFRSCVSSYFLLLMLGIYVLGIAKTQYGLDIEKLIKVLVVPAIIVLVAYIGVYGSQHRVYNYCVEYYNKSYYLPRYDNGLICWETQSSGWSFGDMKEHEFISLDKWLETIK